MTPPDLVALLHRLHGDDPAAHPYTLALRAQVVTGRQLTGARVKQLLLDPSTSLESEMTTSTPDRLFAIDIKLFPNTKNTKIDLDGNLKIQSTEVEAICEYLKSAKPDDTGRIILKVKGWRRVSEKGNKFLSCLSEVMASELSQAAKDLADAFDGELI